jgi:hypothetical protein
VLRRAHGDAWQDRCGVTADRVGRWRDRQRAEAARHPAGTVEPRLLYFADFYDLRTIVGKSWDGEVGAALGDRRTTEVFLNQLDTNRLRS